MILAPRWALSAQAIDATNSPHLPRGVHLRILPSPDLGFPIAPFMVYRASLGPGAKQWGLMTDITWTTLDGQPLTPPIQVSPDRPVVGHLPDPRTAGACLWIEVLLKSQPTDPKAPTTVTTGPKVTDPKVTDPKVTDPKVTDPKVTDPKVTDPKVTAPKLTLPEVKLPRIEIPNITIPDIVIRPTRPFKVEAQVFGAHGPSTVASRSQPPYQLGAGRIDRILVSGQGTIEGVRWLSSLHLEKVQWQQWRLLALPVERGARYTGVPHAEDAAKQRVHRGAPLRLGLHDAPSAADPAAAPAATPADEWVRVSTAAGEVLDYVKRVVDDTSAPQTELRYRQTLLQDGKPRGEVEVPVLRAMLQFALDPGIGRYLGLCDCDEDPASSGSADVVVYLVRALWSLDQSSLGEKVGLLPKQAITEKPPETRFLGSTVPANWPDGVKGPFLELYTVAAATIGVPPDPPPALTLGNPIDGDWLPAVPPAAIREVGLPVRGAGPGAGLAVARRVKSDYEPLNREDKAGRRQLIYLGQDPDVPEPGSGTFWDDEAPPDSFGYCAAQCDWFGRWSPWREASVPAKARPRPPQPVIHVTYTQPAVTEPVSDGLLSGTLRVRVEVPPPAAMAPGSLLLSRLELTVNGSRTSHPLASPASPAATLEIALPGPGLARAARGAAVVTAQWIDTAGNPSLPSEPIELTLYDPRPAVHLTFPNTLAYTSRPDVTGRARAVITWTPGPGHDSYRLYAADETGVRARLEKIAASPGDPDRAAAAALLAETDGLPAPDRAARYRSRSHLLRRDAFELLTGEALPAAGPTMRYEHAVSGSLRVLMFYRVVPVTAAGVESDFEKAPLLTFGVPNSGPPATPEVAVTPVIDPSAAVPYAVRVSVRVPRGPVPAARFRVRRSSVATMEPLTMPVVAAGTVAPPEDGSDQSFTFLDEGAWMDVAPAMRLRPWRTYYYGVEVQAPDEPGSTVPGEWSPLSPVVAAQIIPPEPPRAAYDLTVTAAGKASRIRFRHPDKLDGGSFGQYQVQIYRRPAGGRESLLATLPGDAADDAGWFQYTDASPERIGASYRVLVIDPIGRRGAPTAPAAL